MLPVYLIYRSSGR